MPMRLPYMVMGSKLIRCMCKSPKKIKKVMMSTFYDLYLGCKLRQFEKWVRVSSSYTSVKYVLIGVVKYKISLIIIV